jgi:hypothetical protein
MASMPFWIRGFVLPIVRTEQFVEHSGIAIDKDASDRLQYQALFAATVSDVVIAAISPKERRFAHFLCSLD